MDKLKINQKTFTKSKLKTVGFTLVELIIVITILAILATIAFISFKNYSSNARDGNRMATLKNIETGLLLFQTKTSSLPSPENYINIIGSGSSLLSKQGYIGKNITSQIRLNTEIFDPKDNSQYLYSTNGANSKYQLGTYLEEQNLLSYFPQTYASIDYSKRFFYTIGNPVGIILDELNSPLSITTDLILNENNTNFKVYFSNDSHSGSISGTGGSLIEKITEYQQNTSLPVIQNNCSFSGSTILHGNSITLYKLESIDKFDSVNTCQNNSLERFCNNGVLSGDEEYIYSNCVKGEVSNCSASGSYVYNGHTYNIPALNHSSSTGGLISASVSENNGTFSYTLDSISCNDGNLINPSEASTPTLISCNSGYGANGNSCNLSQNGMCNNSVVLGCSIGNAV
ncbi:MAG: type II secretion system protein [Candidatus Altimarinota bacterium]